MLFFYISIHSLARRLTSYKIIIGSISGISIHSLARRLTASTAGNRNPAIPFQFTASQGGWRLWDRRLQSVSPNFNSQPRKEADLILGNHFIQIIHFNSQPRKEADEQLDVAFRSEEDFNSQPRKEADLIQIVVISGLIKFQFTASQGGWPFQASAA